MRVALPGVGRSGPAFRFRFDGREIEAFPGETLAAALLNADVWALRRTRAGKQRGIFCGMGVCGECSVMVDGAQRRACLDYAKPGSEVSTMPALAPAGVAAADAERGPAGELAADLIIVGAGPAGLAAAHVAASAGLDVLVVDERAKGGGQYFKQPGTGFTLDTGSLDPQFKEGAERTSRAEEAGARFTFGSTVWGAYAPNELVIAREGRTFVAKARRIILCPGAYERPHMVPGWTLPGVMTTGAAQTLLRGSQTTPGRKILIAGNGPLNLQVARELVRAGAEIVALAELAAPPWRTSPAAGLALVKNAPRLAWEGVRHLSALRAAHVPVHYGYALVRAEGDEKVRRGTIARLAPDGRPQPGTERSFDLDSICMGYGFLPQNEIARAFGCAHRSDERGGLLTVRDEEGRTSVPEIFVAGDAGGLGGARIALAQGIVAAAAAAKDLGVRVDPNGLRGARRLLKRHAAFQRALWTVYAPRVPIQDLTERDTLICRCEEIGRSAVEEVLETGLTRPGAVKRASRVGMGRCQGRYCGANLALMINARADAPIAPDDYFAPRSPFKPVTIASAAARENGEH